MKNIYIADEYISSQKNGIGTFLQELLFCLKGDENNLNLLVFNADTKEFAIVEENGITKYLFPAFKTGHFLGQSKITDKFLRLYISDSSDNIFFLNHSPCADFIESLKTTHSLSKVVFAIHDFGWTNMLMGDLEKYKKILENGTNTKNNPVIESYNIDKRLYDLADGVICLSEDTYRTLQDVYQINRNKLFHISNGLREMNKANDDSAKIKHSLYLSDEDKILLFVGRPTKPKGIFDIIAAMDRVLEQHPTTKLVIVGDGNEVNIKDVIKASSHIASSVIFTGQINRTELKKWFAVADMGIISSYYEQCSYTAIEMMMFGLPIVASDGVGIRNMFIDNVNAKVAHIGNRNKPKEYRHNLSTAIIELLESPELAKRLGVNTRKVYDANYSIIKMKDKYIKLIESF